METAPDLRRRQSDAYLRDCPSREILDLVANRWTALVVGALVEGPLRFCQLRRRVEGISQKVLTQNLRALERDGMVRRAVYPTTPPSVEYSLTELGEGVGRHLVALRGWVEAHLPQMHAARAAYDARAGQVEPEE
ncbi:transcriptional regulator, HxlR family [Streptoalloteichus tenebrarius]|uniref:Transcriptional regulator, HxlR family n=1 Tax=Streptoalloteichus tenebrarius (strain ATCC 17920 / DSM 40477 / JCM 4838 / CBS 697.72 / NBRC 16177 / NCIMB 11028 / NRRL B-12390 / A12253. 1 / ISP 5477) TaxID=1933 RepID=A0ABT1I225_STRSD|nr:helix-turn-helix domain-containing protein [Streptoalloteichus tenebrarius]MCP2261788.1 transcriptional regulator, HxlR family [Streptoalloteichus tenebrarius]BFF02162.1 helix-turn-helix domain-containing protein [Streptoalloteichus tenebrarius]